MENDLIKRSLAFATLLQVRLRSADIHMSYSQTLVRECMFLTTKAVEFIPPIFNKAPNPGELIEAAGFIHWPLDMLAEELEKELEKGDKVPNYPRIHRLAGCLSVKLAHALKLVNGEI